MDDGVLIWGPWIASGLALALSGLSLLYAALLIRRAEARNRRMAVAVARREARGYWPYLDREMVALNGRCDVLEARAESLAGRVDTLAGRRLRDAVSIARTAPEPELAA